MWSHFITSFLLASFVSLAACASFESIVETDSDLTTLSYYLKLYPDLLSQLNNSRDITFLAPSNDAIQGALSDQGSQYSQGKIYGWIDDIISYHTLNGTVGSTNISETPHFARSWLNDSTWTSVSGGQVVGYVYENGKPTFTSGIQTHTGINKADIAFDGGIIHILDGVLEMPLNTTATTYAMDMPMTAQTLANKKLHSGIDTAFPDMTLFIPPEQGIKQFASYIDSLPDAQFQAMMGYHLIVGTIMYSCEAKNESLPTYTVNNEPVQITVVGDDIYVNSAKVVVKDILINSGVAHILDQPLNPANKSGMPPIPPNMFTNQVPSQSSNSTNNTTTTPVASSSSKPKTHSSGLSAGAYAGIGVGAAAGSVALVALLGFLCLRRRRIEQQRQQPISRSSSHASNFSERGSAHAHLRKGNPRVKARKGVFKPLPEKPLEAPAGEVARELEGDTSSAGSMSPDSVDKRGSIGWAELDSRNIMAQIPQDIYEVRAELEGDDRGYGNKPWSGSQRYR